MRLVYFGSAEFALPALQALREHVVLVVSQPDRPQGRKGQLQATPVAEWARAEGLPVETPERARNPEFIEQVRALEADALVVAAYGQILRPALLESARRGGINLHGSLLPRLRGAAPIQRAVEAGFVYTGVTLMQMDEGMDTGGIIARETLSIGPDETAGELTERMAASAAQLAVGWLPAIVAGEYPCQAQDSTLATLAPKITREDLALDLGRPSAEVYARHRAYAPAPGAFIPLADGPLKVREARRIPLAQGQPGEVLSAKPELVVACGDGAIHLRQVQPAGKGAMPGADWARGRRLEPGDRLPLLPSNPSQ
jgi:methionyl-tRNA formyltransferase